MTTSYELKDVRSHIYPSRHSHRRYLRLVPFNPDCKKGVSLCSSTTTSSLVDASSTFAFATDCYSQLGTVRVELILSVSGAIICTRITAGLLSFSRATQRRYQILVVSETPPDQLLVNRGLSSNKRQTATNYSDHNLTIFPTCSPWCSPLPMPSRACGRPCSTVHLGSAPVVVRNTRV